MLVEIPVYYNKKTEKALKFEELEMQLPDGEDAFEKQEDIMFIDPEIVHYIEKNMEGSGSFLTIGNDERIETPMSITEAAKLFNEALSK
jgi:hypothetical protein